MGTENLFSEASVLFRKVCEIFNKTENDVDEDVRKIKEWLETQPHLPEIMGDFRIRNFLITNKFSIERTKQKIDTYYTIRSLIPDFFQDCNPKSPQMRVIFENTYIGVYPKLCQNLYRVIFCKMNAPNKLSPREHLLTANNIAEVRISDDCFFYDIYVIDFVNVTFHDITKVTPSVLANIFAVYEKVYSLRVKAIYFINAPPYISKVVAILKLILKPKIFSRIQVHENDDIMKELFSADDLAKDYGGNGPTLQELTNMTRRKFGEYESRFDQLDKMRVDESLRPEKLIGDDILGVYGNFRKLNVD